MKQKRDLQFVNPLLKRLKQLNKNERCVYPNCEERPIRSHVIAESVLRLLADDRGEVLTWEHSEIDIVVDIIRGNDLDHAFRQPKSVSIQAPVTYPIFCEKHDNELFKPLEKSGRYNEMHKVALFAYRALCYKTWNPNMEAKLELFLAHKEEEIMQRYRRIMFLDGLLEARQIVEDLLRTQSFHQKVRWISRIIPMVPSYACINAMIPYRNEEELTSIANGSTPITAEDIVTFTFFPDKKLNASVCIITWFRDNVRGEHFIEGLRLNTSSEAEIRTKIITNVLRMPLIYASHIWWSGQTPELQKQILDLQLDEIQAFQSC